MTYKRKDLLLRKGTEKPLTEKTFSMEEEDIAPLNPHFNNPISTSSQRLGVSHSGYLQVESPFNLFLVPLPRKSMNGNKVAYESDLLPQSKQKSEISPNSTFSTSPSQSPLRKNSTPISSVKKKLVSAQRATLSKLPKNTSPPQNSPKQSNKKKNLQNEPASLQEQTSIGSPWSPGSSNSLISPNTGSHQSPSFHPSPIALV